jgi:hypothetical protein
VHNFWYLRHVDIGLKTAREEVKKKGWLKEKTVKEGREKKRSLVQRIRLPRAVGVEFYPTILILSVASIPRIVTPPGPAWRESNSVDSVERLHVIGSGQEPQVG